MTYVWKGARLHPQQLRPVASRDLLWITVNGYSILNVYREPRSDEALQYVLNLSPPPKCVVGGDFNVRNEAFEPGASNLYGGADLADWAANSRMEFIGKPGAPTHQAGHVIDLTFSNVPFASTAVRNDLYSASDHYTQVTTVPNHVRKPEETLRRTVHEDDLEKFEGLVQNGMAQLPNSWTLTSSGQIDDYATALSDVFQTAISTAGRKANEKGHSAPWWTEECKDAYKVYLRHRNLEAGTASFARRNFLSVVRKAKQSYWRNTIDNVRSDKDLYKVVGWHKLGPNLQSPPLNVNGTIVEDNLKKAETLQREVLFRFSAEDDLPEPPRNDLELSPGPRPKQLDWEQSLSLEEVERNTIGVTSTSPGPDRVTVRLLKACWGTVKDAIHGLYHSCLALSHFPTPWKLAEVAMIPKVGKKDWTSVRS